LLKVTKEAVEGNRHGREAISVGTIFKLHYEASRLSFLLPLVLLFLTIYPLFLLHRVAIVLPHSL